MSITAFDQPVRHWIIEPFAQPDMLQAIPPPADDPCWTRYDNDCERRKRTWNKIDPVSPWGRLFGWLASPWTVEALGRLTGIDGLQADPLLYGAGLHVTDPGGWLQVHADYEIHSTLPDMERRLSLVLPVHQEWREEWGGELLLCDAMGKPVRQYLPLPNRAMIFENGPSSFHGVRVTTADAPLRITAAAYFLGPIRPTACRKRAMFLPNRASPGVPNEVK